MDEELSISEFSELLKVEEAMVLVDLRLADDFERDHLEGALNYCVFEMSFLSGIEKAVPDRRTTIGVYGACAKSHESRMAVSKLRRAGYETVFELRDGIEGWSALGLPTIKGTQREEAVPVLNGTYGIDMEESRVEWVGRNLVNKHWGRIGLKSGEWSFVEGRLMGGEFVMDMGAITCTDLKGSEWHDVLIGHLESDDFFEVETYPEARFVFDSSERINGGQLGALNHRVVGYLTLKGITGLVPIDLAYGVSEKGKPAAQTSFSIDRTHWNVLYGSGGFFKRLAGHLVNDTIEIELRIVGLESEVK